MRRLLPLLVVAGLLLGLVPSVAAAEPVTFGTPTADSTFGKGIEFRQPVTVSGPIGRVAHPIGPSVE